MKKRAKAKGKRVKKARKLSKVKPLTRTVAGSTFSPRLMIG